MTLTHTSSPSPPPSPHHLQPTSLLSTSRNTTPQADRPSPVLTPTTTTHSGTSTPSGSGLLTPNSTTGNTPLNTSTSTSGSGSISWAAAKAKSDEVRRYPSFATRNTGFFARSKRRITAALPLGERDDCGFDYGYEYEYGSGYGGYGFGCGYGGGRRGWRLGFLLRRRRLRALVLLALGVMGYLFLWGTIVERYRRSPLGGGHQVVVILESNVEGGVMEWKGAREWAIERASTRNKEQYARRWGYELEVVNMLAKKRYSHEWRESWEKVDLIRETMRKYPRAEWFWWIDLNTWIMEPSYSLQDHIFKRMDDLTYRDINAYNPLNISHPPTQPYLDETSRSAAGDRDASSIQLLLSQDCSGFSLGSFLLRRSLWSERLLDSWWDPVMYEQKHMDWEHKEQDALEYLYDSQPWVRSSTAFLPQRTINAFPPGACVGNNTDGHYSAEARDFVVNMAGCAFGRDCWTEMHQYRELSAWLNRGWWQRVKDGLEDWYGQFGRGEVAEQTQEQ